MAGSKPAKNASCGYSSSMEEPSRVCSVYEEQGLYSTRTPRRSSLNTPLRDRAFR